MHNKSTRYPLQVSALVDALGGNVAVFLFPLHVYQLIVYYFSSQVLLILHCSLARELGHLCSLFLELHGPKMLVELLACLQGKFGHDKSIERVEHSVRNMK